MRFHTNKAQSTLEYALIIAIVVAGLVAMNVYMKRGIQGKLRESSDRIGEQYSAGRTTGTITTEQVDPMRYVERTGEGAGGSFDQGVSHYEVLDAAEMTYEVDEKVEADAAEPLFDPLP